jgi:hypothetical protein
VKVRVYLVRRRSRVIAPASRSLYVERDVNPVVWRAVLGTYRDLRREGASQPHARAIVKFALEAVS